MPAPGSRKSQGNRAIMSRPPNSAQRLSITAPDRGPVLPSAHSTPGLKDSASEQLRQLSVQISARIRQNPDLFADAVHWFMSLRLERMAGSDTQTPGGRAWARLMEAWHRITDVFRKRSEDRFYDLSIEVAKRVLMLVALTYNVDFDGRVIGLEPMPWDSSAPGQLEGRGWVWAGVSGWSETTHLELIQKCASKMEIEGWSVIEVDPGIELARAMAQFAAVLDASLSSPDQSGTRRVLGAFHAVTLSEAGARLDKAAFGMMGRLMRAHGNASRSMPAGLVLMESDLAEGPWTEIPAGELTVKTLPVGGGTADAAIVAALDGIRHVAAFPVDTWNARQSVNPGGPHQRWHAGDALTRYELDLIESAAKLLRARNVVTPGEAVAEAGVSGRLPSARAPHTDKLTPNEVAAWNAIAGRRLYAHELGVAIGSSTQEARECVMAIRKQLGENAIKTCSGGGYVRPDNPPPAGQPIARTRRVSPTR